MDLPADNLLDVAYFSMEIALESKMPTYSGGLGVLAGDILKTMADFGFKAVGITLLNEKGYTFQQIYGHQVTRSDEHPWPKEQLLEKVPIKITITIEGRQVVCQVWRYLVQGQYGRIVPVYLIDTNLPQNDGYDRNLTSYLYGGDSHYRLCQEQLLGICGFKLLAELGYSPEKVRIYHLNEGHAAFLGLSLYSWAREAYFSDQDALRLLRSKVVFTTHTPVPAGHDHFLRSQVQKSLDQKMFSYIPSSVYESDELSMTRLALYFSGTVTGVARKHEKISEKMFPDYDVITVTNGVHHLSWTHPEFGELYDEYLAAWRRDPNFLRSVLSIPDERIWKAHQRAKQDLIDVVKRETRVSLSPEAVTFGFARRVTAYKRPTLIFSRPEHLEALGKEYGTIQIIFAGKAHPQDQEGLSLLRQLQERAGNINGVVKIVFLENYDLDLALQLVAGVDVWVNTPIRPYEASGTSGMKAAMNCVPHLSVLDGWWPEGWIEGLTGWSIGSRLADIKSTEGEDESDLAYDEADFYHKLETSVLPTYYKNRPEFINIMKHAAALNGSRFNTYRMVGEYVSKVYFPLKNRKLERF